MSTRNNKAFTIIELIVVITAIAILASIAIVGYGNWRNDIRSSQIRNDLVAAASAMEESRSGQNGYPTAIPTSFTASEGVTVTLFETTSNAFCIDANVSGGIQHYIDQSIVSEGPKTGTCLARTVSNAPSTPKNLQVVVNPTNLQLSWSAAALTTQYQARCGTNAAITTGVVTQNVSAPTLMATITIPSAVPYFCEVRASNAAGQSSYSVAQVGVPAGVPFVGWGALAVGATSACALTMEGVPYCWGENYYGQLGRGTIGSATNSNVPVAVVTSGALNGKLPLKAISSQGRHVCAIAADDNAYCWGRNYSGQLGNGSTTDSGSPVAVSKAGVLNGKTVKAISAGSSATCVIASDNNAYCWGGGTSGGLGQGANSNSNVPVAVTTSGVLSGKTIKKISAGGSTCAIASDDKAYCWGIDYYGTLGNGNPATDSNVPVAVLTTGSLNGKTVTNISSGGSTVCVTASDGTAHCWGRDNMGQLGNGSPIADSREPVLVLNSGTLNFAGVGSGGAITGCGHSVSGAGYCWGYNNNGQIGNGGTGTSNVSPVAVNMSGALSGKAFTDVQAGDYFSCGLVNDKNVYCWGAGGYGQLGNGTTSSYVPVKVNTPE